MGVCAVCGCVLVCCWCFVGVFGCVCWCALLCVVVGQGKRTVHCCCWLVSSWCWGFCDNRIGEAVHLEPVMEAPVRAFSVAGDAVLSSDMGVHSLGDGSTSGCTRGHGLQHGSPTHVFSQWTRLLCSQSLTGQFLLLDCSPPLCSSVGRRFRNVAGGVNVGNDEWHFVLVCG